jgi:hypothetical protein
MGIKCFNCGKSFVSNSISVKIIGPEVEVCCPYCSDVCIEKLNKFVCRQHGMYMPLSPIYASKAIETAQYIELNSSDYYKEKGLRHGGKKEIRNLRARESAA